MNIELISWNKMKKKNLKDIERFDTKRRQCLAYENEKKKLTKSRNKSL